MNEPWVKVSWSNADGLWRVQTSKTTVYHEKLILTGRWITRVEQLSFLIGENVEIKQYEMAVVLRAYGKEY